MIKVDLHLHTKYSKDCAMPLEVIIDRCVRRGIDCIAVTDHDNIAGALKVEKLAPFRVIVGEEVKTRQGEIIGLFLKEEVPPGLSARETVARIHQQGGLTCVPHPFDRVRKGRLREDVLAAIYEQIDIMEAFNSRTTLLRDSEKAEAFGRARNMPLGAGSDSHTPMEIGGAYVLMPEFDGPADFLDCLREGTVVGERATPLVHVPTRIVRWLKKMRSR